MKRKVLCVFSLIAFLVVFCTLLAPCVEEEMQTQVEIKSTYGEKVLNRNIAVPATAILWQDGQQQLFQIVDGKGWQTGKRVQEVSRWNYSVIKSLLVKDGVIIEEDVQRVEMNPGKNYDIIISASRKPEVGDAVAVVEEFETRDDIYIIYYPKGAEDIQNIPNTFTPLAQSDQAMVVQPVKAQAPFFEPSLLFSLRNIGAEDLRVFSLADAQQFYKMLPLIAALFTMLLVGFFLWGYGCILSRRPERKRLVLRNAALAAVLLGLTAVIVSFIDLPVSLMPKESVLDIGHYTQEFSQISAALKSAGSDLLIRERSTALWLAAGILVAGMALAALLVWLDHKKSKRNPNLV